MDEEITGIRLAGLGGQGIVLAGLILGHAAVYQGLYAAGSNSYGAQSRGSLCTAELVISRTPIDYPRVEWANFFVAMNQDGYDAYASHVMERGEIFYDTSLVSRLDGKRSEKGFDVTAKCVEELGGTQAANVIWTGILAKATGWFSKQGLEEAIRAHIPARLAEPNLKAVQLGLDLGQL